MLIRYYDVMPTALGIALHTQTWMFASIPADDLDDEPDTDDEALEDGDRDEVNPAEDDEHWQD